MSRIWNALRQAEKVRTQQLRKNLPAEAPAPPVNRRKSVRSKPPTTLLVYGSTAEKQPFHEEAHIVNANDRGCMIALEHQVARGQRLFVVNITNEKDLECRVVRLNKETKGKRHVALEFLRPAPEFWSFT